MFSLAFLLNAEGGGGGGRVGKGVARMLESQKKRDDVGCDGRVG